MTRAYVRIIAAACAGLAALALAQVPAKQLQTGAQPITHPGVLAQRAVRDQTSCSPSAS
jgi:hypothetical protein